MYSMWTRDPEYDFSILYFMPGFSYFNVNRLGKRFVNENNMGSPHNGWHTLLSFDDSIADFDRIPSWGIFDQSCFDAGKLSTSQGDFFECGNFASDLPDESVRDWDGWSQDNKAELERGWILTGATIKELGQKIKEFDPLDGCGHPEGHLRGVPGLRRRMARTLASTAPPRPWCRWTVAPTTPCPSTPAPAPPWAAR